MKNEFQQLVTELEQYVPILTEYSKTHYSVKSAGQLFDFESFDNQIVVSVLGTAECCSNSFDSIIHFLATEYPNIPAFQKLYAAHHYTETV